MQPFAMIQSGKIVDRNEIWLILALIHYLHYRKGFD